MREFQVHRMPVVTREGKLVGLVSLNDIARLALRERDRELEEDVAATLGFIAEPRPAQM
jgi:CBS domain-containing protein